MVASFAERMAARVSEEDQQTSPAPADPPPGGADVCATPSEDREEENVHTDQMALAEPAARPPDGAGSENMQSQALTPLCSEGRTETAEDRPADLTLGRRGPEEREEVDIVSESAMVNPQQQQNEPETFPAQASLGNNLPLAGCQSAGVA